MMRSVITKAVIPAVEKIRASVARLAATRAAERAPGVPAPPLTAADIQAVPVIMLFDGEHEFLTQMIAICIAELEMRPELKGWILIKLAASCSKTEQPCDVSPVFMALKALSASKLGFKFEGDDKTQADWIENDLLANIPAASRRTFLNFLLHAPNIIGDALRPHNIAIGWSVSGICVQARGRPRPVPSDWATHPSAYGRPSCCCEAPLSAHARARAADRRADADRRGALDFVG